MIALWMCYATVVTALLVAGAWAADGALAALGRPRRWAWAAAVAGGLALPAGAVRFTPEAEVQTLGVAVGAVRGGAGEHAPPSAVRVEAAPARTAAASAAAARMHAESLRTQAVAASVTAETNARASRVQAVPGLAVDAAGFPTDAALRSLVVRYFPRALDGGMGAKPFVWLVLDSAGRVTHTATGPGGLGVAHAGFPFHGFDSERAERVADSTDLRGRRLVLDREAVRRKFPDLGDARVASYAWTRVADGRDTAQVILALPR